MIMYLMLPFKKIHVKSDRNYLEFTTSHMFQAGRQAQIGTDQGDRKKNTNKTRKRCFNFMNM